MKILVIGGTGNISRWFIPSLTESGHEVILYNRGNRRINFPGRVRSISGDRTNHAAFEEQMKNESLFDCVIDMAGFETEDAESAVLAFKGRTGQYIFCSTVDVFNKQPRAYPISESNEINASPTFPYAHKKAAMEKLFFKAFEQYKFPVTILRPAATYSEGWSPLVTSFGGQTYHLDRLRKGKQVILHGDGMSIWVACHSQDVASAFLNAVGNARTIGQSYNITGDELMTWQSMHTSVSELLGAERPKFVYIPTSVLSVLAPVESEWCVENFQFNNIFDNSRAKKELNFRYTIPYQEGARRCIRYIDENNLIDDHLKYPFYDEVIERWNKRAF